jgi:methionyl aminopeptidase
MGAGPAPRPVRLNDMINLKSRRELEIMRASCRIVAEVLEVLRAECRPGITTRDLDRLAEEETLKRKAKPAFKGYRGFPGSLCTSINQEVVHGIPGPRVLGEGDIVSLDFGALYEGYYGDAALTVAIGTIDAHALGLLRVTEECLYLGIEQMKNGNHLTDISRAIQTHAESHGFSIVREFGGHGIGRKLHEDPWVYNYVIDGRGVRLQPGLVLALEPMVNMGTEKIRILPDGWTVVTLDSKPSAHFEHTVAITEKGPEILTRRD